MGCSSSSCCSCKCCGCKSCSKGKRMKRVVQKDPKNQVSEQYVVGLRGKVRLQVGDADDFLTHHLHNEVNLCPFATSRKIRARQIIQHYMFSEINRSKDTGQVSTSKLTEFALKAWFQRSFKQALERAEKGFLVDKRPYEQVRAQLSEEYIFQIYQMGEFINAGFGKFSTVQRHIELPLSLILLNSDSALYPLLGRLQQKYPLVTDVPNMTFPDVPKIESKLNVLKLFNSKCYEDPDNLNIQSLMDDLKFVIDEANDLKDDFKSDMIDMLGVQVQTDCKVKRKQKGQYKAEAVRRVFIKWSETLIQRIPEVYTLKQFVDFIRSKKKMADQFIFKGVVSPTTHQQVIDCLSELLQSLKYKVGTKIPKQEFGLFIYDFLRCKTTRNTGEQVVQLLQKMIKTKTTRSGKRFQVTRVKNRFKWATRDLLINFRYGEHIIGEAQLCVDVSHESDDTSRQIKFRHLLYELQRGLFGPTFEMMMLFEDASRKDIQVNLQSEGIVKPRYFGNQSAHQIKISGRKCPQSHDMIEIVGNVFDDKITGLIQNATQQSTCDFCFKKFLFKNPYHYCYYCSIFYCIDCLKTYQNTDKKIIQLICTNHQLLKPIQSAKQLQKICSEKKGTMVVFYRPGTSASLMYLDQIAFLLAAFRSLNKAVAEVYTVNVSKKQYESQLKALNLHRTPTTIIFNSKMQPQVTVIGSSFHDIQSLFRVKDRIAKNQPKGLELKCSNCHTLMTQKQLPPESKQKCQNCMDTNKMQDLKDVVRMMFNDTKSFMCRNGHVRCAFCSYLSNDAPSYYRDHTGRTYLSNKFVSQPSECSNGHDMISVNQPKEYTCFNCEVHYRGNEDQLLSACVPCKEFICIQCEETDGQNYKQKFYRSLILKQVEIVTHFVQNRLEESYPCGCGKYFLKVYQSRKIQDKTQVMKEVTQLIDEGVHRWTCKICKQTENKLRVHLGCFYCTYAQQVNGRPSHTQICIGCALKSGLLNNKPKQKVLMQPTQFKCLKNHPIILTSQRRGDQLRYDCTYCKTKFYPYTERYECEPCKTKICRACSGVNLVDPNVYKSSKKCFSSHDLVIVRGAPKLQFCSVCSIYLQETHFKCPNKACRFFLCLNCSK